MQQQLSRLVELFENPVTDSLNTRHALEPPAFQRRQSVVSASWQDALGRIVETQIIPSLLLSNLAQHHLVRPPVAPHSDLGAFIKLLLDADTSAVLAYVHRLEDHGMPLERIVLDLLGGASRYLGALWEADHCDFIDVIDGLRRLHNILQAISPISDEKTADGRRVILSTAPCETHDFGITIVERFFRTAGWQTHRCLEQDLAASIRDQHFEVVGFSLSCERYFDGLRTAVAKVRQVSQNQCIQILVGGMVFLKNPELVRVVGADGMAADAPGAVTTAETLLVDRAYV